MIHSNFELGDTFHKFVKDTTLLKMDKCVIKVFKDSLALPLTFENVQGYFIHGNGRLLIDTIIETRKGAFGKPTEKELKEPFIAVGNIEGIKENIMEADRSSLTILGYADVKALREEAEETYRRILRETIFRRDFEEEGINVFYFSTECGAYQCLFQKTRGS